MPHQIKTLLQFLDRTPPVMVRTAAVQHKKGHNGYQPKRKTMAQLIADSGVPRRTFQRIMYAPSWEPWVGVISRCIAACGVDITKPKPLCGFIKGYGKHRLSHLTTRQKKKADSVVKQIKEANQ